MKSLYKLTNELHEASRMLEDCLQAWGVPNGWDRVKDSLDEQLKQARARKESDIPPKFRELSLKLLVLEVLDVQGGEDGRSAELELLKRLKLRKHATIQGPATLIYQEKGMLVFSSIKRFETFSGKFLAYDVGAEE